MEKIEYLNNMNHVFLDNIKLDKDDLSIDQELLNIIDFFVVKLAKGGHFYECIFAKNHLMQLLNLYEYKRSNLVNELHEIESILAENNKWSKRDKLYVVGTFGVMYPIVRKGYRNELKKYDKKRHEIIQQISHLEKVVIPKIKTWINYVQSG